MLRKIYAFAISEIRDSPLGEGLKKYEASMKPFHVEHIRNGEGGRLVFKTAIYEVIVLNKKNLVSL